MSYMKPSDRIRRLKAKLFRGFGDPSRLSVLEALREGPRCVSEVVTATGLSQPNASAHLACLGDCGLVTRERRGKFVYYAIADKRAVKVLEDAEEMLEEIGARVSRCTRYKAKPDAAGLARSPRRPGGIVR
jgi:ArsR family transcriptional regulator, cadmium/lead-responsive transcriptional repressor